MPEHYAVLQVDTVLLTAQTNYRYVKSPLDGFVQDVYFSVGSNLPADAVFDVMINGTSIWAADPTLRPKILSGASGGQKLAINAAIVKGDVIRLDVATMPAGGLPTPFVTRMTLFSTGGSVPVGGTANQVLSKINATDYNTQWSTPGGGGAPTPASVYTKEDFNGGTIAQGQIGECGWSYSGSTVPEQANGSSIDHPGVIVLKTGGTNNTMVVLRLGNSDTPMLASTLIDITFVLKINNNDAQMEVRAGIGGPSAGNPPDSGIYLERLAADTSWFGVARTSTTQTRSAAVAATTGNWVNLRVRRIDASTVGFTVDGGTEQTVTTNIPSTPTVCIFLQIRNTAAVDKWLHVDFVSWLIAATR